MIELSIPLDPLGNDLDGVLRRERLGRELPRIGGPVRTSPFGIPVRKLAELPVDVDDWDIDQSGNDILYRQLKGVRQRKEEKLIKRPIVVERDHGEPALTHVLERRPKVPPQVVVPAVAPSEEVVLDLVRHQLSRDGGLAGLQELGPVLEEKVNRRLGRAAQR